jgi:hypothetical protein
MELDDLFHDVPETANAATFGKVSRRFSVPFLIERRPGSGLGATPVDPGYLLQTNFLRDTKKMHSKIGNLIRKHF